MEKLLSPFTETRTSSAKLMCVVCKDSFVSPWDLMVHAQAAHMINIYEIGEAEKSSTNKSDSNENTFDLNCQNICEALEHATNDCNMSQTKQNVSAFPQQLLFL